MCYAIYIGSDQPLPTSEWNEADRTFYVTHLTDDTRVVSKHFSKRHVYYAGSHQGCGCGFFSDPDYGDDEDEKREYEDSRADVRALVEYLNKALEKQNTLEFLVTWEGQQTEPVKRKLELCPEDLLLPEFPLDEQDFAIIKRKTG